jgi:hypothetical protein
MHVCLYVYLYESCMNDGLYLSMLDRYARYV